ncbi:hypothetical protein LXL04_035740 [Taraxacum kok-saghyz]
MEPRNPKTRTLRLRQISSRSKKEKVGQAPQPNKKTSKEDTCLEHGVVVHWKRNCPTRPTYLKKKKKKKKTEAGPSSIYMIEIDLLTFSPNIWVFDTMCETHICNMLEASEIVLHVGNEARVVVQALGDSDLHLPNGLRSSRSSPTWNHVIFNLYLTLNNRSFIPTLTRNIISVARLKQSIFTYQVRPLNGIYEVNLYTSPKHETIEMFKLFQSKVEIMGLFFVQIDSKEVSSDNFSDHLESQGIGVWEEEPNFINYGSLCDEYRAMAVTTCEFDKAFSSIFRWNIFQIDSPPSSIVHQLSEVCRLQKISIWSQTSHRAWFEKFSKVITCLGFTHRNRDSKPFVRFTSAGPILLSILGLAALFLWIKVSQSPKGYLLSLTKYIIDLFERTRLTNNKTFNMSLETNARYFATNISKSCVSNGILSPKMHAYVDACWDNDPHDHNSTTVFCIFIGDSLVSWKHNIVCRSFTTTEYRAMVVTTCEIVWLCWLLVDMGVDVS